VVIFKECRAGQACCKRLPYQTLWHRGGQPRMRALESDVIVPKEDNAGAATGILVRSRPLIDRLMDVGVQLREHRDELVLMSGFIIVQPLQERLYTGIIGDTGRLTVAFIELALHR
jgi:hypothetical protein